MPLVAGNYAGINISATQAMHANTIIGVGQQRRVPVKGIIIALMTAMQESKMGTAGMTRAVDHDSLGLFQQRPSQGWGTPAQVMNTVYATNKFYDTLLKVPGWQAMGHSAAAQAVQRSAFPTAYAKWQGMAEAMVLRAGVVGAPSGPFATDMDALANAGNMLGEAPTAPDFGNIAALSDPATWKRIGFFLLGCVLLVVAFFKLTGDNKLSPVTKAIGKAVVLRKVKL
jgi:peptidoglycan DL-endopeptidase CwlO